MANIIGNPIPNLPWQEKPKDFPYPVWRYSGNPIITRDNLFFANSIFNSAVVPFRVHWQLSERKLFEGYDPRLCEIDGVYYLTWVKLTPHGTVIGVAYTENFAQWTELEEASYPVARNGVLFPRRIGGEYVLLIRPCDRGHTPYGDIFLMHSRDLTYWGKHRFVMAPVKNWEMTKVGAGPTPIETDKYWLMLYHGVLTSCNGFSYSMGAALLDKNEPWKVLHRADSFLLGAHELYECVGDVPNVVFPCAALADADTGRIAIYYGAADTSVALAFTTVDDVIDYVLAHDCAQSGQQKPESE